MTTDTITFQPDPSDFPSFFEGWGDDQLSIALRDGIRNGFDRSLRVAFGEKVSKINISDYFHVSCLKDGISQPLIIKNILDIGGISTSGLKLRFDLTKDATSKPFEFRCEGGIKLYHWLPDFDPSPVIQIRKMKKCDRVSFRFYGIEIPASALPIDDHLVNDCRCPDETLKPYGGPILLFECFVCGKRYICECFRGIPERLANRNGYDTKPYAEILENSPYRANSCHLCRGVPSTTGSRQRGKSEVHAYYWRYINDFAIGRDMEFRDAENLVRDRLGVPRIGEGWIAEANLLRIVQSLYPEHEVLHQASPDWLGRQRFDIFVPELRLAIEYNGEQHYHPIERFGGERGLEATKQRDQDKRAKAKEAGVTLIEFRYDEEISPEYVSKRIKTQIKART